MLVNFKTILVEEKKLNPLVTRYKAYIAKPTKANGFTFSREVLDSDDMKLTIPSSPVVASFVDCDDGKKLGGHTGDLVKTKSGYKRSPNVQGIGFVTDTEPWWEEFQNEEWITCYCNIWTSYFEGLQNLSERNIYQSMEVSLETDSDGNKIVTECYLNALCMLEDVKPAFDGSTFEEVTFSKQDYSSQIEKLQKELDSLNRYSDIDFSIPSEVKTFSLNTISNSEKLTSVCKSNLDYLSNNDYISPDKAIYIQKYFSKIQDKKTFSLSGEDVILNWCESLITKMKSVDKNGDVKMKSFSEEFKKDEIGSGDYTIKIDKSKDSVSNDAWGDVDKTALMHKVLKAKNATTLVKDVYIVVENGWEDAPSQHLKYPVMQIKDSTAVYNSNALSSALAYANHPDTGNSEVASKIEKIQKKLGLLKDDKKKEGEKENMTKFTKTQKEEFATKFSMTANQIKELMNDMCKSQTFETEYGDRSKYWICDFDDTYMYGYDEQNGSNIAIPFTVSEDNAIVPDFENVKNAKSVSVWVVDESEDFEATEDDGVFMSAVKSKCAETEDMCNIKMSEMETKLSEANTKLTETEAKMGEQFAATTSLESALEDEKKINEERQKQIDELSAELKKMSDEAKTKDVKTLMSKKEFIVFDETKKAELVKMSEEKTYDEFKTLAYAELGKFASANFEFEMQNGKFSYMHVPTPTPSVDGKENADNVYAQTRKKFGKKE